MHLYTKIGINTRQCLQYVYTKLMATFQPTIRSMRNDGLYPVYIRITHNRKIAYLKTDKLVSNDDIRRGKINDPFVNRYCYERIEKYGEWLNSVNTSAMDVNQVRNFLIRRSTGRSFTDFYKMYVENHLLNYGNENNAMVYKAAYKSFEHYVGGSPVEFSCFNKATIMGWIESMHNKKRARTLYPTCLRKLFNISQDYGSDPSTGFLRMDSNPWTGVEIPRYTKASKGGSGRSMPTILWGCNPRRLPMAQTRANWPRCSYDGYMPCRYKHSGSLQNEKRRHA